MNDFNWGLLTTTPLNIGEEIQSIAAMRFLPKIDEYIHRDLIFKYKSKNNKKTKLLMNAWWMWNKKGFPPSEDIIPLLISMYIRVELRKKFLTPKVRKFLIKNGPVGCRDSSTSEWLNSEGIPAYFSGCLTLTLQPNEKVKRKDYILCVDVDDSVIEEIKKRTDRPVYNIGVEIAAVFTPLQRLEIAKIYLALYQNAHCVISNRLHVILPCLAFKTPVLKLDTCKNERSIKERYAGYENLANTCTVKDFLENPDLYNLENPPSNPEEYLEIRQKLIESCKEFTGFDNEESYVYSGEDSLFRLIGYLRHNYREHRRSMARIKMKHLLKELLCRILFRKKFYSGEKVSVKTNVGENNIPQTPVAVERERERERERVIPLPVFVIDFCKGMLCIISVPLLCCKFSINRGING